MFYQFPVITHIDDVLPHIEGWPEFRVMDKGFYTVVNYMVSNSETFSNIDNDLHGMSIRRECRGLIFDSETGNLISRPYHKFFNVGERVETQIDKINLYQPHVILEKLDGSMIRPIPTADGFRLATKAGITDISEQAEEFIADKPQYAKFILECINQRLTPIFEWVSRKNRIVVDYPEDNLILTAIRKNDDGTYFKYGAMKKLAESLSIPVVKAIDGVSTQNIHLLVHQIREWDDGEGVVLRFDDGHMDKIKADDYVLRHKSKDAISQEKNVIDLIVNDQVDDLIPLLTVDDVNRILQFQKAFWLSVDDVASDITDQFQYGNKKYPDKKDFAVKFVQGIGSSVPPKLVPIMYKMRSGTGAKEAIIQAIQKSVSTQTKIDENRWLFGNLQWNQSV
jgi:RNA ligase